MEKYRVTVLGGYSGKVATRYFETKQKMLNYVSKVIRYASEVTVDNLKKEESRWGKGGDRVEHSRVDWA